MSLDEEATMSRLSKAVTALALGLAMGLGGSLGFTASSPVEQVDPPCIRECTNTTDCFQYCGNVGGSCMPTAVCDYRCVCGE